MLCNGALKIQTNNNEDKNKSTSTHTKNTRIYVVWQIAYIHGCDDDKVLLRKWGNYN